MRNAYLLLAHVEAFTRCTTALRESRRTQEGLPGGSGPEQQLKEE